MCNFGCNVYTYINGLYKLTIFLKACLIYTLPQQQQSFLTHSNKQTKVKEILNAFLLFKGFMHA